VRISAGRGQGAATEISALRVNDGSDKTGIAGAVYGHRRVEVHERHTFRLTR
jgi:hypothetical protein